MEIETTTYQKIDGYNLGLKFFGNLTEGKSDRVIGIVIEYIEDANPARWEDLGRCQNALAGLHGLGVKFGDFNRHNLLIQDQRPDVVLVDFESAKFDYSPLELEEEMNALSKDKSGYLRSTATDTACEDTNYGGCARPCY